MKSAFYIIAACLLLAATAVHAEDRMTVNGVQYATTSDQTATACLTVKAIGDIEIAEKIRIKGKMYTTTEIGKRFDCRQKGFERCYFQHSNPFLYAFRPAAMVSSVILRRKF